MLASSYSERGMCVLGNWEHHLDLNAFVHVGQWRALADVASDVPELSYTYWKCVSDNTVPDESVHQRASTLSSV